MSSMITRILILGGYGNFGRKIAENLCVHRHIEIILAGRNLQKARLTCQSLSQQTGHTKLIPFALDFLAEDFIQQLTQIAPNILIHTSGPFQGQDYRVARACLDANCHYIDLADDRRFVCDFNQLNKLAINKNLQLISGASSVPGLSSTVISLLAKEYRQLNQIDIAIAPGNQAERGEATLRAILSNIGKPLSIYSNGEWTTEYGWMSSRQVDLGEVLGKRRLANVDVPDLELFPKTFNGVHSVRFQAGLELGWLHQIMVAMAWLNKNNFISNWTKYTQLILAASRWFENSGTDTGGMRVQLDGINTLGKRQLTSWTLIAKAGIGPFIPSIPAVILVNQLITSNPINYGAQACVNLFQLQEFDRLITHYPIEHYTERKIK